MGQGSGEVEMGGRRRQGEGGRGFGRRRWRKGGEEASGGGG